MDNTIILSIVLLFLILIVVIIQVALYKKSKKQRKAYPELWKQFELSKKRNDHNDIFKIGNKLFYNKFLPTEHLQIIHDTAQELESKMSEFKNLRLNAQQKLLQRTKEESDHN